MTGLAGPGDQLTQPLAVLLEHSAEGRPGAVQPDGSARGGVVAGERRRLSLEHEPVDGREEAQREGRASRVASVLSKHLEGGTTRLGVVGGVLQQMFV